PSYSTWRTVNGTATPHWQISVSHWEVVYKRSLHPKWQIYFKKHPSKAINYHSPLAETSPDRYSRFIP
ncbi:TPA: hypothetical protein ACYSH8_004659, partial [Kluyvera ascorbata]